jgi:hypothetical protein
MQPSQNEVERLTDQELDAYARVVADESRYRRTRLDRAKNYRGRQIIPVVVALLAIGIGPLSYKFGWGAIFAFFAAVVLMQWHSAGLNKRIDSLIDLLELNSIKDRTRTLAKDTTELRNLNQQAEQDAP